MLASITDDPPILVSADLQVEYLTPGRRHVILDGEVATARCLELLTVWRGNLWPVMHLKRIAQAAWFNPASRLTDWIVDAKPRPGEMTFEHPLPSAYSSSRFVDYMSNIRNVRCVLAGFSLDETNPGHRCRRVSPQPSLPGGRRCGGLPAAGNWRRRHLQACGSECDRKFCYNPVQRRTDQSQRRRCGVGGRDRRMEWDIVTGRSAQGAGKRPVACRRGGAPSWSVHDGVSALDGADGSAGSHCRRWRSE
ncbi:hypothetical protein ACVWWP_005300 [Bradyrhizobium sp. LM3.6]